MTDPSPKLASLEMKPDAVPLSVLREGDRGRLHATNLCCEDCDLLNAMGMTDQCEIRVCQRGEPCIVQVNSTRLGLSAALARNILVTLMG
jgi:Fe2+ transport system protein FeoA